MRNELTKKTHYFFEKEEKKKKGGKLVTSTPFNLHIILARSK